MQALAINKFVSLGLVLLILLSGFVFFPDSEISRGQMLLYATMFIGYGHYIIGGYYQLRKPLTLRNNKMILWFIIFSIFAALFSFTSIHIGIAPIIAIIAIGIFILHGSLNEELHIKRLADIDIPTTYWFGIAGYLTLLTLFSLAHPSFFFTPEVTYAGFSYVEAWTYLQSFFPDWLSYALMLICGISIIFCVALPLVRARLYGSLLSISCVIIATTSTVAAIAPISYTYLFYFLLSYHFITWAIFAYQSFTSSKQYYARKIYLTFSGVFYILLSLIFVGVFLPDIFYYPLAQFIFNFNTFLVFTYVHIISSFLNEPWLQKYLNI